MSIRSPFKYIRSHPGFVQRLTRKASFCKPWARFQPLRFTQPALLFACRSLLGALRQHERCGWTATVSTSRRPSNNILFLRGRQSSSLCICLRWSGWMLRLHLDRSRLGVQLCRPMLRRQSAKRHTCWTTSRPSLWQENRLRLLRQTRWCECCT